MKKANYEITVHVFHDKNEFMKKIDFITKQNNLTDYADFESKKDKMRRVNESMKVMCL